MAPLTFDTHVFELSAAIHMTIGSYCETNGIPWDAEAFRDQSPHDIDEIAKDALLYGAETFPDSRS